MPQIAAVMIPARMKRGQSRLSNATILLLERRRDGRERRFQLGAQACVTATMASAIPDAINPYSIAVAPLSSNKNLMTVNTGILPCAFALAAGYAAAG
jgi:hypothetical protein